MALFEISGACPRRESNIRCIMERAKERMPRETKQERESAGGVQSLRRAMAILQVVAESPHGIGLADMSKKVGLHNSTTFHIARTLAAIGLLRQEPESRQYRIGPQLFGIAAGALDELELLSVAEPILRDLALRAEATSHVAVRAGSEVVILGKCESDSTIRIAERIGSLRPPYATAIGKALLAFSAKDELDRYLANTKLVAYTLSTLVDASALRRELDDVRQKGLAIDNGEYNAELRCFASPVQDFRGRVVAAVGISVPVWRLNVRRVGELGELVRGAANQLSIALGSTDRTPTSLASSEVGSVSA